jgi:hypothetical protein
VVPRILRRTKGFIDAMEAANSAAEALDLPPYFSAPMDFSQDYRLILKPPGGVPFGVRFELVYMPGSDQETNLGQVFTARV